MNDGTFILHESAGNTLFRVHGDEVRIEGYASEGAGETVTRETARAIWAELVRGGAVRIECRDEDGHDGEHCTCGPEQSHRAYGEWDPIKDGPLPGTLAFTARLLARAGIMTGDEADDWKDRMKDERMGVR